MQLTSLSQEHTPVALAEKQDEGCRDPNPEQAAALFLDFATAPRVVPLCKFLPRRVLAWRGLPRIPRSHLVLSKTLAQYGATLYGSELGSGGQHGATTATLIDFVVYVYAHVAAGPALSFFFFFFSLLWLRKTRLGHSQDNVCPKTSAPARAQACR